MAKERESPAACGLGTVVAGKTLGEYWSVVKLPVLVVVAWSIIQMLAAFISPGLYAGYGFMAGGMLGLLGSLIGLVAFLYIGWSAIKTHGYELMHAAVAGGVAGVITGIVAFILSIVTFFGVGSAVVAAAAAAGMGYGAAAGMFTVGAIVIGGITGLIVGAIVGAILAGIGAFAAQNVK
ncbi:MAG: hypothetical protein QW343_03730 [Candidatus Norongarragalinales archaeon]